MTKESYNPVMPKYDTRDIKSFYKQMLNSDWYKKRLAANGYSNPEETAGNRNYQVQTAKVEERGMGNKYFPSNNFVASNGFKTIQAGGHPRSEVTSMLGQAELNEFPLNDIEKAMMLQNNQTENKYQRMLDLPINKGNINSIRYNLYRSGLYDPSTGRYKTNDGLFNKEMLDKVNKDNNAKRLRSVYDDKDLINLMNTIAMNDNEEQITYAQLGGILTRFYGL